jgi:hypothetical protein
MVIEHDPRRTEDAGAPHRALERRRRGHAAHLAGIDITMSRVAPALTCEELTKRYRDGALAPTGVGVACYQAGAQGVLTPTQAVAMPLALLEIAAIALFAGHRFGRRDVVLAS